MTLKINNYQPLPQSLVREEKDVPRGKYLAAEKAWSYASKSLAATRNMLNASLRSCQWFSICGSRTAQKVQAGITRSKIFSVITVPFNTMSIPTQAAKIGQSYNHRDWEGIYLGLLSFAILLGDTIDSLATSVNAALMTFTSTSNSVLASLGLPLGFFLVSFGSLSRGIRIYNLNQFCSKMGNYRFMLNGSKMTPEEIRSSASRFLNDLGLNKSKKNVIALERHTTTAAANLLKDLSDALKKPGPLNDKEAAQILETFHQIDRALQEELVVQGSYAATNLLIFTSLCLLATSFITSLPYLLLTLGWSGRLLLQSYQDFYQTRLPKLSIH